ncbi:MAG: alpha/beta hydrolase [Luminiphilus sp.]|nr:alpha/beta hydrolase [Luminiphilus sp.]
MEWGDPRGRANRVLKMKQYTTLLPVEDGALTLHIAEASHSSCRLICVHGWTLDHNSFERQLRLTQKNVCLVRYDRRGHGTNFMTPDLTHDLIDLKRIVDASELPTVLLGVSQGARLCLRFIQYWPNHVAGIIFQGGVVDDYTFDPDDPQEPPLRRYSRLVQEGRLDDVKADWLTHKLMTRGVLEDDKVKLKEQVNRYLGQDLVTTAAPETRSLDARLPPKTPLTRCATNALIGRARGDSTQRVAHAERLALELNGQLMDSRDGHLWNWTHPESFNHQVATWLRRLAL